MNNNPAPSTVPGESKNCKRCEVMLGPHSTNVQRACLPPFTPLGLGTPGTSQAPYKARNFVHCPTAMLAELDCSGIQGILDSTRRKHSLAGQDAGLPE